MKKSKKFVAALLAAVLALGMLTACGSNAGTGLEALVKASKASGKSYLELERIAYDGEEGATQLGGGKTAYDGTTFWSKSDTCTAEQDGTIFLKWGEEWSECEGENIWLAQWRVETLRSFLPTEEMLEQIKVKLEYQVMENVTCYAEIVENEDQRVTYCFEDGTLKYLVYEEITPYSTRRTVYNATFAAKFPTEAIEGIQEFQKFYKDYKQNAT